MRVADPRTGIVDVAAVRGETGETPGALLVVRATSDRTDRSTHRRRELAASLVPSVLGMASVESARQALVDWAAGQPGPKPRSRFGRSARRDQRSVGYRAGDTVLRSLVGRIEYWAGRRGRVARAGGARYLVIRTTSPTRPTRCARSNGSERSSPNRSRSPASPSVGPRGRRVFDFEQRRNPVPCCGEPRAPARQPARRRRQGRVYTEQRRRTARRLPLDLDWPAPGSSGSLRMHYQPEFDLATGEIVGVEALLRWQHPERGAQRGRVRAGVGADPDLRGRPALGDREDVSPVADGATPASPKCRAAGERPAPQVLHAG